MGRENYRPPARYALEFGQGAIRTEIDAFDRADAFAQAQKLVKHGRPATLYEDGEPLAEIGYAPSGFWTVSTQGSRAA
jgi:hypothetical protein